MAAAVQADVRPLIREGIRRTQLDCVLKGRALAERVCVQLTPNFDTACWVWRDSCHNILVGADIVKKARAELDDELMVQYAGAYVRHEYSHARWTERDLETVNARLKTAGVPFSLFNLFEDARIEHREREASTEPFGWLRFEQPVPRFTADAVFWSCIQFEGDFDGVREHCADKFEELDEVIEFYEQALKTDDFEEMLALMQRWLEKFPPPEPDLNREGGEGLAAALELAMDEEAFAELVKDAEVVEGPKASVNALGAQSGDTESVQVAESGAGRVLSRMSRHRLDAQRVARLSHQLKALFVAKTRPVSTWEPSRRVSLRNDLADRAPYRQRQLEGRRRRKVHMLVDCSGSMMGLHIHESRYLIAALSELARAGVCEGRVTFSLVHDHRARHETWKLPMPDERIGAIEAPGEAEGLESAMHAHLHQLREADLVMVYTDGHICDHPIDKAYWHNQGVFTWGLYVGQAESMTIEMLSKFFDRTVVRDNAEELLQAMIGLR